VREHVEVRCLAPDETSKRHDGVVAAGLGEERHGPGQLERTGDLEKIY